MTESKSRGQIADDMQATTVRRQEAAPPPTEPGAALPVVEYADAEARVSDAPAKTQSAPVQVDPTPALFGSYELLAELARGGMGVVYKARDLNLGRIVALKMLIGGRFSHPEELSRFHREASAAAQLRHSHIVAIYEVGHFQGHHFYTMDFVPGGSLAQQMARFADPRAAATLIATVARAVQFAHDHNILHRDLKPGNILIDDRGEPCVADFGLAKVLASDAQLTHSGDMLGTPAYMAPEQAAGRMSEVGVPADVWALGVILYELLVGQRPFQGERPDVIYRLIRQTEPLRPRRLNSALPRDLETIVQKCLEKEPGRRYSTAGHLADDLERWLRGEAILARPESLPRRTQRFLRRHVYASVALAAISGSAATLLAVKSYDDYHTPDKVLLREIAAGRPAVLIAETGSPRFVRPAWGNYSVNDPAEPTDEFYFESASASLLELLPNPAVQRYRISAEIRHIHDFGVASEVGIYFGHRVYETPNGQEHWYYRIEFADVGSLRGSYPDPNRTAGSAATGYDRIYLHLCRRRADEKLDDPAGDQILLNEDYPKPDLSSDRAYGPWHHVEVKVDPNGVQVWWNEKPLRRVSRQKINSLAEYMLKDKPNAAVAFLTDPMGQGGIGLFAEHGTALYRNVIVEPLP